MTYINTNTNTNTGTGTKNINISGKDFLSLLDFTKEELTYLLDVAAQLKHENKTGKPHRILENKTLAMIFSKPSLRTRVSFEVGISQLGGNAVVLKQDEINLGVRETIADTARVLERYVHGVMIRTFDHNNVVEFAKYSSVPVINALTDLSHPCQVLADLLTVKEHFGKLDGLKLAYLGDGNNMANSLISGCAIMGMDVAIGCPQGYEPDKNYVAKSAEIAAKASSQILITSDPAEAVANADVVYTDVWASMGQEAEAQARREIFKSYQVNSEILRSAKSTAIVLHCLPAHRGEEIAEDVLEQNAAYIFEEAENRLHAQKAIMASVM